MAVASGADSEHRKIDSLQGWRGVAAMLVVFFHAAGTLASDKYGGRAVFDGFFSWGHAGVEFFFVLSGFIIYWAHRADLGRPKSIGRYVKRRLVRIYPVYWAILLPLLAIYLAIPSLGTGAETNISNIITSFFLIGPPNPVLTVAWTLFHEVLFYAMFGVAIISRGFGAILMGIWFMGSFLGLGYALSPLNVLFLIGMLAAWVCFRPAIIRGPAVLTFGIVAFVLVGVAEWRGYFTQNDVPSTLLYGASAFLLVVGSVRAEQSGRLRTPRALSLLGDASYSLYLIHYPVISLVAKFTSGLPAYIVFVFMVTASILAGTIMHLMVEKPMLTALLRKPLVNTSSAPVY